LFFSFFHFRRSRSWWPEKEKNTKKHLKKKRNRVRKKTEKATTYKDLHLIMGQKHLIWDRVWDVKSTKSNLYLHIQYIYFAPIVLFLHENPLTSNLDIVDISRYTDICIYIYPYRSI
jgi:hypothetical protein